MGAVTERNIEGKAYRQTQVSFLFSTVPLQVQIKSCGIEKHLITGLPCKPEANAFV